MTISSRADLRVLLAFSAATFLTACSSFNTAAPCEETALGVQRAIAEPTFQETFDPTLLNSVVHVSNLSEVNSGYNQRICTATINVAGQSTSIRYSIHQSEGLKKWYQITILNGDEPGVASLTAQARSLYSAGG